MCINQLVSQYCCILSYTSTGTGGSFTDPALPPNKVTPFVLRITLTAFDGVTTVVVSRNINIGKCRFNHCGLAIESVDSCNRDSADTIYDHTNLRNSKQLTYHSSLMFSWPTRLLVV